MNKEEQDTLWEHEVKINKLIAKILSLELKVKDLERKSL